MQAQNRLVLATIDNDNNNNNNSKKKKKKNNNNGDDDDDNLRKDVGLLSNSMSFVVL